MVKIFKNVHMICVLDYSSKRQALLLRVLPKNSLFSTKKKRLKSLITIVLLLCLLYYKRILY